MKVRDRDEIELATETRVAVLRDHRKDIKKLRKLEDAFLSGLLDTPTKTYTAQYQGKILKEEIGIPVTDKCQALNNLANVQHKRIQLERQAFNLKEGESESTVQKETELHPALKEMLNPFEPVQ